MKIKAILDKVVVKPEKKEKKSGGFNLTNTSIYKENTRGTVVSVGAGTPSEPMQVKEGDTVWFNDHVGVTLDVELDMSKEADEHVIIRQKEIIFIEE